MAGGVSTGVSFEEGGASVQWRLRASGRHPSYHPRLAIKMPLQVVETLCDLVRLPSVNPMGRAVSGAEYFEYQMTEYLEKLFTRLGLPFEKQTIEPKRANIFARLDGHQDPLRGGQLIVFEAHQDTVPVDGMTIPPWTPEQRDGRVYGRGACDIKGGMACMLTALSRLLERRPAEMPTIIMACSVNEEYGFSGAKEMGQRWASGDSAIVPRVPDAVIVAEPTDLNVVVAHKGVARWTVHTRGRASHSSKPELGVNAIYSMAKVLNALESYAREVAPQRGSHPLVGRPSLSVGTISGGLSVNTVPDHCSIQIDRRVLPGEDNAAARQHVIDYVRERIPAEVEIEHEPAYLASPGLSDGRNATLAQRLGEVAQRHGAPGARVGVPYGTDAPAFDRIQAPTVVFGPGSIEQAHTCDEWIAIEQLEKAADILTDFGSRPFHP
jgi:acetylornithine deacetylase/succinyl-diaminopimelate desuccinylase family protein